jgi:tryptophan halogenase
MTKTRGTKNLVILGGGATGWITALYAQRVKPDSKITVVESEDIGILGAGEGSTPHLVNFLDFVGIPVSELVKHADATIKNGIKFTNWKNDSSFFYHGFFVFNNLDFSGCNLNNNSMSMDAAFVANSVFKDSINDASFASKISENNKVPFVYKAQPQVGVSDSILNFDGLGYFSIHFNAAKLATFLKKVAMDRGVVRVEGVVDSIESDDKDDITSLKIGSKTIPVDFVFDCSGFAREIIGKKYSSKWKSHSDKLPVDSAVPFFVPLKEDEAIAPYTEAIAMKYGWMWKIPTKERYGCGYVYDSSLITEEEAVEEIEEYLGYEPFYPRKNKGGFKFSAGYYEEPWKNNCIAVGLASGFIEPLEATSIWVTIQTLKNVFSNVEVLSSLDDRNARDFNKKFRELSDAVVDFIYFHYMSGRTDTEFWTKFSIEKAPDNLKNMLETWEYRLPQFNDFTNETVWGMGSWMVVAAGIDKLNTDVIKHSYDYSFSQKESANFYSDMKNRQNIAMNSCVDHNTFLEELRK